MGTIRISWIVSHGDVKLKVMNSFKGLITVVRDDLILLVECNYLYSSVRDRSESSISHLDQSVLSGTTRVLSISFLSRVYGFIEVLSSRLS